MLGYPYFPSPAFPMHVLHNRLHSESTLCEGSGIGLEHLAMLMRRWERARQRDEQLPLIVGEPGLGKSRPIEEFHGRLRDTPHTWVEWSCSQLSSAKTNTSPVRAPTFGTRRPNHLFCPLMRRQLDADEPVSIGLFVTQSRPSAQRRMG